MKPIRLVMSSLATVIILVSLISTSHAVAVINGNFETGDFTGWTTIGTAAITSGAGDDPLVPVKMVYEGQHSAQIGDSTVDCNYGNPGWKSSILQTVTIPPPPESTLSFWYAVGAQGNHPQGIASGFILTVSAGSTIIHQDENEAYTSPNNAPGWTWIGSLAYYPWTLVTVDLSAYAGQQLTINFTVHDCLQTGHAAWGYLDDIRVSQNPTAPAPERPVGGVVASVDKLGLLAPWAVVAVAVTGVIGIIIAKKRL